MSAIGTPGPGRVGWAFTGWSGAWQSGAARRREALFLAAIAGSLAALICWTAPPGTDFAAHAYQRSVFLDHGFQFWNNFWYAGHYSFITYSLLYYPLAAVIGIKPLAVITAAVGTLSFSTVLARQWGTRGRLASLAFAGVWGAYTLTGAFPFALGMSLALLAILALQSGSRGWFAVLSPLTLAASPLAFLMLALALAGIALAARVGPERMIWPAVTIGGWGFIEVLLWRVFPSAGHQPFSSKEVLAGVLYCASMVILTWRVDQARHLRYIFLALAGGCIVAYATSSDVGANMIRYRFVAVPLTVLALSLRDWRPRLLGVALLGVVLAWNLWPLVSSVAAGNDDGAASATYWRPAIGFLRGHLTPSYRVEAVGTARHWEAAYLPRAGIPLTRGWFRQDDFPLNRVLYRPLSRAKYVAWLRSLGVRYVLVTSARPDYSARHEIALLRSGRSGLRPVFRTEDVEIFRVPSPRRIVSGPSGARIVSFSQARLVLKLRRPGTYRLAVRYSPYWHTSSGCLSRTVDGLMHLTVPRAATAAVRFEVSPGRLLDVLTEGNPTSCR
jgi:hypothetical protein